MSLENTLDGKKSIISNQANNLTLEGNYLKLVD